MTTNLITVTDLIQALDLQPLEGEGGLFTQSYLSSESISARALPARYARSSPNSQQSTAKPFGTAIYYLLTRDPDSFSALHRLPSDEIFHFYLGDPVEGLLLHPDGSHSLVTLGQDLLNGQHVQFVAPRGSWQGWRLHPGGETGYALLGTTMAPGYTLEDYEPGVRAALSAQYPAQAALIAQLTRE